MQEAEYSVPPERLAGGMPFQGLRRPQAVPEACLVKENRLPVGCFGAGGFLL